MTITNFLLSSREIWASAYIPHTLEDATKLISHKSGPTKASLIKAGLDAQEAGSTSVRVRRGGDWFFSAGQSVKVLPNISIDLAPMEDPMFRAQSSFLSRRLLGPPWHQLSCSLDTVLMALIQCNAGRTRADQVFIEELFSEQPTGFRPSLICMRILMRGIDGTSAAQRGQLRDYVRQCLVAADAKYFRQEEAMDIIDIAISLFEVVPQVSYTTASRVSYDRGESWSYELNPDGTPLLRRHNDFQSLEPGVGVDTITRRKFRVRYVDLPTEEQPKLSSDEFLDKDSTDTTKQVMKLVVIVDRVPYVAMVTYGAIIRTKEEMVKTWSFNYTYREGQRRQATYAILGYAILAKFHYILYWRAGFDIIIYDGMRNNGTAWKKKNTRINDFSSLGISGDSRMQLVFYRLESDIPVSTQQE